MRITFNALDLAGSWRPSRTTRSSAASIRRRAAWRDGASHLGAVPARRRAAWRDGASHLGAVPAGWGGVGRCQPLLGLPVGGGAGRCRLGAVPAGRCRLGAVPATCTRARLRKSDFYRLCVDSRGKSADSLGGSRRWRGCTEMSHGKSPVRVLTRARVLFNGGGKPQIRDAGCGKAPQKLRRGSHLHESLGRRERALGKSDIRFAAS